MRSAPSDRAIPALRGAKAAPLSACARIASIAFVASIASIALPLLVTGCGSAPPPAPASDTSKSAAKPPSTDKDDAKEAAERAEKTLPATCTPGADGLCVPPEPFVKRLCGGSFPDLALVMFGKDTPWSRGYLRRTVEAWNASGGASSNEKVEFDEEVLLLVHRAPDTGGMQVSGSGGGGYEALRWDGTCVSLMAEEVTTKLPPKAKNAKIPWKLLDSKTREALAADEKVGPVVADYRKECKGASFGEVSDKCVKADKKLTVIIVDYVRGGGAIPVPASIP